MSHAKDINYRFLFEQNQDGVLVFDMSGICLDVNYAFEQITGFAKANLIGYRFERFVHPDDLPTIIECFQQSLKGMYPEFIVRFYHKYGYDISLKVNYITYFLDEKAEGVFAIVEDITSQLQAEKQLIETTSQLESFFNSTNDAINITDINGVLSYVNPAFEKMFGWSKNELIGRELPIIPHSFQDKSEGMRVRIINGENISNMEAQFLRKNGSLLDVEVTLSPLKDKYGILRGIAAITRDISERKRIENAYKIKKRQYELVTNHMSDLVCIINLVGEFQFTTPSFLKVLGYKESELIGKNALSLIHPNDLESVGAILQKIVSTKEPVIAVYRFQHKSGYYVSVESFATPIIDLNNLQSILVTSRDVTERVEKEQALLESEQKYRLIAENSTDLIQILAKDGTANYVSPSFQRVLGYSPDDFVGRHISDIIHPDDLKILIKKFQNPSKTISGGMIEYRFLHKNGNWIWFETTVSPVFDPNGELSHYIAVARMISERKQYEEQLKQLAFYDGLTGIPNRRLFQDRFSQTLKKANQYQTKLAIFYLDCDRFKWVNDTFGHDTGDLLLKDLVKRVEDCLRDSDTLARLGGDEFAILMDGFDSTKDVVTMAKQLIRKLQVPWIINDQEFTSTSSIGIALFPFDGTEVDTLLACADKALYESKQKGRNMYQFFTEEIAKKIDRSILLEDGLKLAISHNHFHLLYQPQVNIHENQMVGVEALLRYTHPTLGSISPYEFIPLCEKLRMMDEVTEWVMSEALQQQKLWKENGYGDIQMSINISPTTLQNELFLKNIQRCLEKFGTNPNTIEFEITEESFLQNINAIKFFLEKLKQIGVGISLDDFGTGYSSLKYYKDLPIDKLKIDRSFIQGMPFQEKDKAIIESILTLTHRLHSEVICEGVETEEQLHFLRESGCQIVQGYYFSQPLTSHELEEKWIKRKQKETN